MAIHPRHLKNLVPFLKKLNPGEDSDENEDDDVPPALEDTDGSDTSNQKGCQKSKNVKKRKEKTPSTSKRYVK